MSTLKLVPATDTKWLSTAQLCAHYGVDRSTIHRWVEAKRIPAPDKSLGRPRWWSGWIAEHDRKRMATGAVQ